MTASVIWSDVLEVNAVYLATFLDVLSHAWGGNYVVSHPVWMLGEFYSRVRLACERLVANGLASLSVHTPHLLNDFEEPSTEL